MFFLRQMLTEVRTTVKLILTEFREFKVSHENEIERQQMDMSPDQRFVHIP